MRLIQHSLKLNTNTGLVSITRGVKIIFRLFKDKISFNERFLKKEREDEKIRPPILLDYEKKHLDSRIVIKTSLFILRPDLIYRMSFTDMSDFDTPPNLPHSSAYC